LLKIRFLIRAVAPILLILVLAAPLSGTGVLVQAAPAGDRATDGDPGQFDPTLSLKDVLARFDDKQKATNTLVASFTEQKELKLLEKPVVSQGEFFYTRPNQVRWEYLDPDRKVFVITEDRYTAYYPALKRAEEVPIKKFVGKRLFRFLGVGQSIEDLGKYYDFALADESDVPGTYLLLLTPRKKKLRDRVAEMKIWVDGESFLPSRLQYVEADGDTTLLAFTGMQSNIEVSASRFQLDLPQDVVVSQTFNGFSLGQRSF
jgi:outer membrane lipoprotein carrier protein